MGYSILKEFKLSEICTLITDGTHATHKVEKKGKYLATIKDMRDNGIDFSNCKIISESDYDCLLKSNSVPKIQDLLFAKDGSILKHVIVNNQTEYAITSHIAMLRTNIKIVTPSFLKYYLLNPQIKEDIILNYSTGSVIPSVILNDLKNFKVLIPPLKNQKSVTDILSSIDDKIELNNKINKSLEEIAQTLYKRWFVDFEFPNENGEPYKSSGGEMVDSELGMIPKGWEVKDVNSLFYFKGGSQPPKEEHIYEPREGYVRFIQNRDYGNGSSHLTYIKVSHKNKLADKYDIMMDKYGEVGKIRYGLEGAYNVALAKIESCDKLDQEILRGYFSQETIVRYLSNSSIASTRGSLNATTFTGLKVAYPEKPLKLIFHTLSRNIIEMILEKKSENSKLGKIRDELLPKLMSGEIEVPVEE